MSKYLVTDCEWNRHWRPDMIEHVFDSPPSYLAVTVIEDDPVLEHGSRYRHPSADRRAYPYGTADRRRDVRAAVSAGAGAECERDTCIHAQDTAAVLAAVRAELADWQDIGTSGHHLRRIRAIVGGELSGAPVGRGPDRLPCWCEVWPCYHDGPEFDVAYQGEYPDF